MGKVFSWREIKAGMVPESESFPRVVDTIRIELGACQGILGAVLCGSVLWNGHNRRSDVDCLVIYDPALRQDAMVSLRAIVTGATGLNVPVELIALDADIAATPLHHIGTSFTNHLRYAADHGGIIKGDPLSHLVPNGVSLVDDVRGYLRSKIRSLEKAASRLPSLEEAELHRFLQKSLEAPVHVARKMLRAQNVAMADDSRTTVTEHYLRVAGTRECDLFTKILAADDRYTRELQDQLRSPDRDRYIRTTEEIRSNVSDSFEFVRLNAFRLA